MKKFFAILTVLAFLALPVLSQAAGTLTGGSAEWTKISNKNWKKTVTWVDDTNGTTGTVTVPNSLRGAYLYFIITDPGATSPTDNYDITLSLHGVDYMGGNAMNRDQTNTEVAFPTLATRVLDDDISFALSGNSVNNATGTVTIYIYTD